MSKKDISTIAGETKKVKKNLVPPKYFLDKPKMTEKDKKSFYDLLENNNNVQDFYSMANIPSYLYWDKFRHKIGAVKGFTANQVWYFVRQLRNFSSVKTPISTEDGSRFMWLRLPSLDEILHKIDMFAGGRLFNMGPNITESSKQTYLNRGLIEEAIASSQLEGAHTTRKAAKEMIVQKREPTNESEQMILNNFKTMTAICDDFKHRELSLEMLFEMHSMLTYNTVPEDEQNRLREDSDEIIVQGQIGDEIYVTHEPPTNAFVAKKINELIDYANDRNEKKFTHPIIKAIFLHFWIGYLHPFTDGNGRLARALFYWYLLRKEYWSFMYLPISTIIKKVPMQYAMAYIYSEQDELDVTYFFDFHTKKIIQAIDEFESFLDVKVEENSRIELAVSESFNLNDRQKQLIFYLISDKDPSVSVSSHMMLHNVSRQTASKDISILEEKELVIPQRSGKFIKYFPSEKLIRFAA
ncbi:Fic family protein [Candidatus Kaiserbacteria bacterium]|nr:Fic family protein [Candidatus Kaiserbacteria bacterium]